MICQVVMLRAAEPKPIIVTVVATPVHCHLVLIVQIHLCHVAEDLDSRDHV